MIYDIDFLAVENEERDGTKSGDAIIVSVTEPVTGVQRHIVIDAGFSATGSTVVQKFQEWYGAARVDLVISTHPDSDHINGLQEVVETLDVGELMLHLPWQHNSNASMLGNYERIRSLYDSAIKHGTTVTEPFTGLERFGGAIRILGPSQSYYEELLAASIEEVRSGTAATRVLESKMSALLASGKRLLERALGRYPEETLDDVDDTSPRNQSSVITLATQGADHMMLTGDAGIGALEAAATEYETIVGPFHAYPLHFFQAPHHGSKHNLGGSVLNRILGTEANPFGSPVAFISSAKASEKHPSPKVTNALGRRNARVVVTEGKNIHFGDSDRPGYSASTPVGPLVEDDGS